MSAGDIQLTEAQVRKIALAWIAEQSKAGDKGYVPVLKALFENARMAHWSWLDALAYGAKLCSGLYAVKLIDIARYIAGEKK